MHEDSPGKPGGQMGVAISLIPPGQLYFACSDDAAGPVSA